VKERMNEKGGVKMQSSKNILKVTMRKREGREWKGTLYASSTQFIEQKSYQNKIKTFFLFQIQKHHQTNKPK